MSAHTRIEKSGNLWPGTVTIAELAANTPILRRDSDCLTIYEVQEAFDADWRFEIAEWEYEYGIGYYAKFKDGSALFVSAELTEKPDDDEQWDD